MNKYGPSLPSNQMFFIFRRIRVVNYNEMSLGIITRFQYIWPIVALICAMHASGVSSYYVLNAKYGIRSAKAKASYYNHDACRLLNQYETIDECVGQVETREAEIYFAGCAGYF